MHVAEEGDLRPRRRSCSAGPGRACAGPARRSKVTFSRRSVALAVGAQVGPGQVGEPVHQVVGGEEGQQLVLAAQVDVVLGPVLVDLVQGGVDEVPGGVEQLRHPGAGHVRRHGRGADLAERGRPSRRSRRARPRRTPPPSCRRAGPGPAGPPRPWRRSRPVTASTLPRLRCAVSSRPSSFSATVRSSLASAPAGGEDQRAELRLVLLPVAVDAAVALLDADQAPRDVVVDQVVALLVQVDALGGDVAGEQQPHRRCRPARTPATIVCCSSSARPPCSTRIGVRLQAEHRPGTTSASHLRVAPARRRPPPGCRCPGRRRSPSAASTSCVELAGVPVGHRPRSAPRAGPAPPARLPVGASCVAGCVTVSCKRAVRGEERLQQGVREEPVLPGDRLVASTCRPSHTSVSSSKTCSSVGVGRAVHRPGRAALGPAVADLVAHLRADLGAADVEVLDVARPRSPSGRRSRAGSSSRISSAKDSLSPLCGVALARSSASVCGAQHAGPARLCWVPLLMRLCDSSMTTASQRARPGGGRNGRRPSACRSR